MGFLLELVLTIWVLCPWNGLSGGGGRVWRCGIENPQNSTVELSGLRQVWTPAVLTMGTRALLRTILEAIGVTF